MEKNVSPVDYVTKTFVVPHVYNTRGFYKVPINSSTNLQFNTQILINGYDERSYAEAEHHITVFKMPCKVPRVWLPSNQTSWTRPERIPKTPMSKPFQVAFSVKHFVGGFDGKHWMQQNCENLYGLVCIWGDIDLTLFRNHSLHRLIYKKAHLLQQGLWKT